MVTGLLTPTITEKRKSYVDDLVCDNCGKPIPHRHESLILQNTFCSEKCCRAYHREHGLHRESMEWYNYYTMEAPKRCQQDQSITRCDQCRLPECEEFFNVMNRKE